MSVEELTLYLKILLLDETVCTLFAGESFIGVRFSDGVERQINVC